MRRLTQSNHTWESFTTEAFIRQIANERIAVVIVEYDQNHQQPPNEMRRQRSFWYCFIVEGFLKQTGPVMLFVFLGSIVVEPWFIKSTPRNLEIKWKIYLLMALFWGFIEGLRLWIKDEQDEKKRIAREQTSQHL